MNNENETEATVIQERGNDNAAARPTTAAGRDSNSSNAMAEDTNDIPASGGSATVTSTGSVTEKSGKQLSEEIE